MPQQVHALALVPVPGKVPCIANIAQQGQHRYELNASSHRVTKEACVMSVRCPLLSSVFLVAGDLCFPIAFHKIDVHVAWIALFCTAVSMRSSTAWFSLPTIRDDSDIPLAHHGNDEHRILVAVSCSHPISSSEYRDRRRRSAKRKYAPRILISSFSGSTLSPFFYGRRPGVDSKHVRLADVELLLGIAQENHHYVEEPLQLLLFRDQSHVVGLIEQLATTMLKHVR